MKNYLTCYKVGDYVDIKVDIKDVKFQDNAGQSFANQPTKLIVKVNGVEKINKSFFKIKFQKN